MVTPVSALKNAEAAAIRAKKEQSLAEKEESPEDSDSFSYSPSPKTKSTPQKSSKNLKKLAPIAIFLILIFGVGALFSTAVSMLPGHVDANGQKSWDVQYPAMKIGLKLITKKLLATGSLPSGFAERLSDSGIEVGFLDNNDNFIAGLRPTSENSIALASYESPSENPLAKLDNSLVLRWKDTILTAETFGDYLEADPEFYANFSDATYGRAAGHFDDSANNFYSTIDESRNVFKDYVATGNNSEDTEAFKNKLSELFSETTNTSAHTFMDVTANMESTYYISGKEYKQIYGWYKGNTWLGTHKAPAPGECYERDKNGQLVNVCKLVNTIEEGCDLYGTLHSVKIKLSGSTCYAETANGNATATDADKYLSDITYRSLSYNQVSANQKAASLINTAVNANETYQSMKFFLTLSEAISKMKAGEGSASPINQVLNFLTTSTTTDYGTGAPVQAPGLAAVLTQNFPKDLYKDTSDYSLDRFVSSAGEKTSSIDRALSDIAVSTKYNSNSANLIEDFGNFFVGKIKDITSAATTGFIASLNPKISQSLLFTDLSDLDGLAAGEIFARGGSALGGNIAKFTQGGTIADESAVLAYANATDHILALDAAADRATHSPFDISSENTFLGSIVRSFGNILLTSDSFISSLSSFSKLSSSSLNSLLPGAFAASTDENSYQTTFASAEACPALSSSASTAYTDGSSYGPNEKADIYCNPIISFDTKTLKTALDSAEFDSFLKNNLQESSNDSSKNSKTSTSDYEPIPGSDLDLFMKYNNGRQSTFAIKNSNTYNEIVTDSDIKNSINEEAGSGAKSLGFFKRLWQNIKGFFGEVGDFFKKHFKNVILEAGPEELDTHSLSISNRVNRISTGEEFANAAGGYWDTYKYAQAYITYSRVLDQLEYYSSDNKNTTSVSAFFTPGTGENPVASYIASYTAVPEDETDAEYLSRISGLTPDESDFVLGYVAYNTYLASLDYDSYLDFSEDYTTVASLPTFLKFEEPRKYPKKSDDIITNKRREPSYVA